MIRCTTIIKKIVIYISRIYVDVTQNPKKNVKIHICVNEYQI